MAVIKISKEYGTQAEKVASVASEKLGYEYVGDQLLAQIAKELNLSESEAEIFSKTSQSRIPRLVDRYTCTIVQKVVDREHGCLDDSNYYEATKKLVENLYEEGDTIILGWGGQCILKNRPKTLHVRLRKDDTLKIQDAMHQHQIDESAAKSLVEKEEQDMKTYIRQYFKEDWNDARLYDLIIDMGKTSPEQAAEIVVENIKHKVG